VASIVVDERFNGPPHSANGGYLSGLLAAFFEDIGEERAAVEVTLRSPPPLGVPLEVVVSGGEADLHDGATLLAHVTTAQMRGQPPAFVPATAALSAAARYAGLQMHPFPGCFVCGLDRDDGMGLRPGPVSAGTATTGTATPNTVTPNTVTTDTVTPNTVTTDTVPPNIVAAYWKPDASLATTGVVGLEFAWAALDCPGGWATDLGGRPMVLGRMTARVTGAPAVGQPCVVVGEARGVDGRKAFTASALYTADADLLGYAEATWIAIDPAAVRPAQLRRQPLDQPRP
jgi:hypothetical protein